MESRCKLDYQGVTIEQFDEHIESIKAARALAKKQFEYYDGLIKWAEAMEWVMSQPGSEL